MWAWFNLGDSLCSLDVNKWQAEFSFVKHSLKFIVRWWSSKWCILEDLAVLVLEKSHSFWSAPDLFDQFPCLLFKLCRCRSCSVLAFSDSVFMVGVMFAFTFLLLLYSHIGVFKKKWRLCNSFFPSKTSAPRHLERIPLFPIWTHLDIPFDIVQQHRLIHLSFSLRKLYIPKKQKQKY